VRIVRTASVTAASVPVLARSAYFIFLNFRQNSTLFDEKAVSRNDCQHLISKSNDPMMQKSDLTFEYSDDSAYLCSFPIAPLDCNATVVVCRNTGKAAVIDPGGDIPELLEVINAENAVLTEILLTHAHFDHCMSIDIITEERKNSIQNIMLHQDDFTWYENIPLMAGRFGVQISNEKKFPEITQNLSDGDELTIGNIHVKVIHTPGHSAGSVCFYLKDLNVLIAGDTLFQGSIGRTDLPGGSFEIISDSIRNKLYLLPEQTAVITGHGPATSIGIEKKSNAFVRMS